MGEARVSPGIVFVGSYRIPTGRVDDWRTANRELTEFVEASLSDVMVFDAYLDADGTMGTSIHLHRDADSFDGYLAAAATRIGHGTTVVEVVRIDRYGAQHPATVERLRRMGDWPVAVHAHVNGLGRSVSG
jgi:hypothetical protein